MNANNTEHTTEYVFVVGVSRSGTTLMRSILNRSSDIAICRETHFMGHLIYSEGFRSVLRQFGDLSNDENVRRLVEHIYSPAFERTSKHRGVSSHWRWIVRRVAKQEFLDRLLQTSRTDKDIFEVIMTLYSERKGKRISGEKTPAHIRYVPTILEWFPRGRVIHMMRDPRGIFVSELRRRKNDPATTPYKQLHKVPAIFYAYILLQTMVVWLDSVRWYFRYKAQYPGRYMVVKFEDLVQHPEAVVGEVCDFLGVKPDADMLEQRVVSLGFEQGRTGFDAQAAVRWRSQISPRANWLLSVCFRRYLREFGYGAAGHELKGRVRTTG